MDISNCQLCVYLGGNQKVAPPQQFLIEAMVMLVGIVNVCGMECTQQLTRIKHLNIMYKHTTPS